ncbi:MAG TPA: HAD family phosphatase [Gemmatimonadaceae bacterium]|nr:HAD family phosphatase [Gemmatimonadaceae bacterium]
MTALVRAAIFDLDGTLVQTEVLKAQSYARAATLLHPDPGVEGAVLAAYDDMVGRARDEVSAALMERVGLTPYAEAKRIELGARSAQEAFSTLRLRIYEQMIADPQLLRRQEYPRSTALLRSVHAARVPVGVATMSHRAQARTLLHALDLDGEIDALVARDDVRKPKPDPEICVVTAERLGVAPTECVVLEDSVPGIVAALAAGSLCIAVTNAMTRRHVHDSGLLPAERVVDDPDRLSAVVMPLLHLAPPVQV